MRTAHRGYSNDPTREEQERLTDSYAEGATHFASIEEKKRLWWKNAVINCIFISAWFFFATILSVYNKWMFSPEHYGFPYPLFVTTCHMFIQFLMAALVRALWPKRFRPDHSPTMKDYSVKAVPTAVSTALDIGFSNLSLKMITLSFYTMCKSSSLIFVLLFAFLFRLEIFSWRLIAVIFLIFSGVLLMVATETHFVLGGFLLVISASALGGLRWSLTQILLKSKKMGLDNPVATIFWLAPAMGVTLGIVSATIEGWSKVFGTAFFGGFEHALETSFFLVAPGVLAFLMVLSEFYIIQRTGVVPMSIAGIAKEVTTITISAWFFGDELTPLNITGVAITVCGIGLFTFHKYRKSIDSTVPLDTHGNPVLADDDGYDADGPHRSAVELEETMRLTTQDTDEEEPERAVHEQQLLFAVGEDDDGDGDATELGSIHSSKVRWGATDRDRASVFTHSELDSGEESDDGVLHQAKPSKSVDENG
ncbi:hypothetical protein AX16_010646 [Volvariella volvacea WC 439]|nr:hypothetical protein AX16_010646 [Volvariella volvacea WC 439]